jgi:polysaccharide deacetylase family protein (PEP-CTERM system associated)
MFPCSFTVDVEDGISIAMRDKFGKNVSQTDRVLIYTRKLLSLLSKHNVRGTFFTLGKVAEDFPYLIKEIASGGHELAIHGYNHLQFFLMTPAKAREELLSAKQRIEDLTGQQVYGHRAPAFSIYPGTSWAFQVLIECGFTYDSSIMPISGFHYGWPGFPESIVNVNVTSSKSIIEFPLPVVKAFGKNIPFSGGSYLRLFPFLITKYGFKKQMQKGPSVLYIHPYELDYLPYPEFYFEELRKMSFPAQLKIKSNWVNRRSVEKKLDNLLSQFTYKTMIEIVNDCKGQSTIPDYFLKTENYV